MAGDIFGVHVLGQEMLLASDGWRPWLLLNFLQSTGRLLITKDYDPKCQYCCDWDTLAYRKLKGISSKFFNSVLTGYYNWNGWGNKIRCLRFSNSARPGIRTERRVHFWLSAVNGTSSVAYCALWGQPSLFYKTKRLANVYIPVTIRLRLNLFRVYILVFS